MVIYSNRYRSEADGGSRSSIRLNRPGPHRRVCFPLLRKLAFATKSLCAPTYFVWDALYRLSRGAGYRPSRPGGLSMEDLAKMKVDPVYAASKFLQKAEDAGASITVVTAEEIRKYGYRTPADILRGVRGFYVINGRNYSYVGH